MRIVVSSALRRKYLLTLIFLVRAIPLVFSKYTSTSDKVSRRVGKGSVCKGLRWTDLTLHGAGRSLQTQGCSRRKGRKFLVVGGFRLFDCTKQMYFLSTSFQTQLWAS